MGRHLNKKKKVILSFITVSTLLIFLWFVFNGLFFAYCSDAYVRAHVAEIAPRVEGHLTEVFVENNDFVKKGQLLMKIESYPYELKRNVKKASLAEQVMQLKIYQTKLDTAQQELKAVEGQYKLACIETARYLKMLNENATSQEAYEKVLNAQEAARKQLDSASENVQYWRQTVEVQQTVIYSEKAQLDLAEYYLSLTNVTAPVDGYVTNITCRPGDFVKQGDALFGLLDDNLWWIEANYKEYMLGRIKEGQKVWIITDIYPLTVFRGEVENCSRAVKRQEESSTVLPVVSPTTDWIRLDQRFQLRIKFKEKPEGVRFYMGADARTFIWLW